MMRASSICVAAGCACLCLSACGRKDEGRAGAAPADVSGEATVLATLPDGAKPPEPQLPVGLHGGGAAGVFEFVFGERGGGVAAVVEVGGKLQVLYNGGAGKPYEAVTRVSLSSDGRRYAYGALDGGRWRMVVDGVEEQRTFDTIRAPLFSPDGAHLAYQALSGERWHLVVDGAVNEGTRTRYLAHEFNADGSRLAYIDEVDDRDRGRLVVSDRAFKRATTIARGVTSMVVCADRTRVAAVVASGGYQVVAFSFAKPEMVERGAAYDAVRQLVVGPGGESLAYLAERSGRSVAVLNDREATLPPGEIMGAPVVRPDGKAVGALLALDGSMLLRELFVDGAASEGAFEEAEGLTYGPEGRSHAYAARQGRDWFVVVNGRKGAPFDRVVTPQFSPDGRLVVFRARRHGLRFVVVADATGSTLREHPAFEQVFPVRFTPDGKSIAYGVKDGRGLVWRVEPP